MNNCMTVAATPAAVFTYNGHFNMSERTFVTELLNSSSTHYIAMVNELKPAVSRQFNDSNVKSS